MSNVQKFVLSDSSTLASLAGRHFPGNFLHFLTILPNLESLGATKQMALDICTNVKAPNFSERSCQVSC